jgi:lipopolysaccharide/colanic/teichoic acid biosynthesis glycosyltransferase
MELVVLNPPRIFSYHRKANQIVKRVMDVFISLVTLPVTLPLMAIIAVAIRLDSPGPAFFVQKRVGKGGRPFRVFKFRTMEHRLDDSNHRTFMKAFVNGEIGENGNRNDTNGNYQYAFARAYVDPYFGSNGNGEIHKPFESSQVTRIGRFLRKTSLDELPQVINVLKGQMSLIGPRPNVIWEVEEYKPWHYERLEVLPGITGLAQVRGRSSIDFDAIVRYDIDYVENQNVLLDLKILWWTFSTVVRGTGAE